MPNRFTGEMRIAFEKLRRVKLSPVAWQDTYLSRASCRNLMFDLLAGEKMPLVFNGEKSARLQDRRRREIRP